KSPGLARPHVKLADACAARGFLNSAVAQCRSALAIRPDYALALNSLAMALTQKGDLDRAESAYRRAMEAEPHSALPHYNLASLLAKKGLLPAAIAEWQAALKLAPGDVRTHHNLGLAFERLGKLDEAVGEFRQALGLDAAGNAAVFCALARLMRKLDRPAEAVAYYRKALECFPGYGPATAGLAALESGQPAGSHP
ncbi:MAG: tetratricopeptide repeat protein, partial [Planctomycetes bacterium]|nr:tetratricopeptide repeat protein [Planctomycetota bacterium]